jgi:hypothetical protein
MRIIYLSIIAAALMTSCSGGGSGSSSLGFPTEQTYEEKILSIEEEEKANPKRFLDASGSYRENVLGTKMRIFGNVTSSATKANFKDIVIKVTYYSATDTDLGSDNFVLYKFVNAGTTVSFEWKIDKPSGCSKLGWEVVSATPL